MKKILMFVFVLALLPAVFALSVNVKNLNNDAVLIKGLTNPATYNLQVTNNGPANDLTFYTFFGEGLTPKSAVSFLASETKNITVLVYPRNDLALSGQTVFSYFIQGNDKTEVEEKLLVNIIGLGDAISVSSSNINPDSKIVNLYIQNKVNYNLSNLNLQVSSPFFKINKEISLAPYETKEITVALDKADFSKLTAGYYTLNAKVSSQNVTADVVGKVEFAKQDSLASTKDNYGFIVNTQIITKTNNGNTVQDSETTVKKNIVSRLFTTFSPEPDFVQREGTTVYYSWTSTLSPGDSEKITIKTNWLIPFLVVILLVLVIYFARKYSTQKLLLRKRVSFVRAKGGEFALRVSIIAEAREYLEDIRIIDRLPPLVKIYERFGGELPNKISKDKKTLEWDFDNLDVGERRVMTYVVYSKVGVLGKFALPGTIGYFKKDGKDKQTSSNKAYFLAEQRDRKNLE